jgi:hypothetical protein
MVIIYLKNLRQEKLYRVRVVALGLRTISFAPFPKWLIFL